jgi:hypothetical protein
MESAVPHDMQIFFKAITQYLAMIQEEVWELDNQGLLNTDNVSAILSHLASAHYYVTRAKCNNVEHLVDDEDMMA